MRKSAAILLPFLLGVFSCGTFSKTIGKDTPREQYEKKLDKSGMENTPLGRQWLTASQLALKDPQTIYLPYRHAGYFPMDKPRALGLKFTARRGEKLTVNISKQVQHGFVLYADLYRLEGTGETLVHAADTTSVTFSYDTEATGTYLLRLQPELFRTGNYNLAISVGPSLIFPVSGEKARVGSFWGESRDGGKRRHEGIDIFASKRTPVVAAADGVVTGVKEEGLGGKTVWLRPTGQDFTLYYAHLDKQLVQTGQFVKKGDVVGLVGNTGNARHTPSHLHFGVYTFKGPIDPFPFVNPKMRIAPNFNAKDLDVQLRLLKNHKTGISTAAVNCVLVPLAVHASGYIAELPDGKMIQAAFSSFQTIPLKKAKGLVKETKKTKRTLPPDES